MIPWLLKRGRSGAFLMNIPYEKYVWECHQKCRKHMVTFNENAGKCRTTMQTLTKNEVHCRTRRTFYTPCIKGNRKAISCIYKPDAYSPAKKGIQAQKNFQYEDLMHAQIGFFLWWISKSQRKDNFCRTILFSFDMFFLGITRNCA